MRRYTSGNHVGVNDVGAVDCEVDGAYYSDRSSHDESGVNVWTQGEEISVLLSDEQYTYELAGSEIATLRLNGEFFKADGGRVAISYPEIEARPGSRGRLFIADQAIDYVLYWDEDGDETVDREIRPDEVVCEVVPYPPAAPTGQRVACSVKNVSTRPVLWTPRVIKSTARSTGAMAPRASGLGLSIPGRRVLRLTCGNSRARMACG